MTTQTRQWSVAMMIALSAVLTVDRVAQSAVDELEQQASWSVPTVAHVREQLDGWLGDQELADDTRAAILGRWSDDRLPSPGVDALERLASSLATARPEYRQLVDLCQGSATRGVASPSFGYLADDATTPFVRHNLRLYYGRWLAQHELYDEAEAQLTGLSAEDVVDPESLLFFQSVVYHRLLKKDECLAAAKRLLENEATLPRRYRSIGQLIERDIQPLEEDSLDEISRMMEDIERRLRFGRAGTRVRKEEDDVIAKLDKMIKQMEEQQKQQQQQANANGQQLQPSRPAEDSVPAGGTGPGDVDQRRRENKGDWGNLPPKDRQQALQQISKDLPAHFRDVVEEYFRRLGQND